MVASYHRMSEGMNEEDYEEYNMTIGTIQKEIMKRKEAEEGLERM
jgi:hypothetical protein